MVALPFKIFGVKYIFDHHDANPELYISKYDSRGMFYKAQVWLEKMTYRFSDVVMCTNESFRELALTRGGRAPENVFVVRNGPDLKSFQPVAPNAALKHGKTYLVGYVGTISVQEGLDVMVNAARYLRDHGRNDVHFTCIGDGPGLPALRKMVQDLDLGDIFNFTGRLPATFTGKIPDPQLLEILSTADVCVSTDKPTEGNNISTMIKIMEYMALGKPIVQFDLKEGRFSAREASLYCNGTDLVSDFATKLLWLLDHPEERRRMGEFGRRRVENELAWKYSAQNLLAAYQKALGSEVARPLPAKAIGERSESQIPTR